MSAGFGGLVRRDGRMVLDKHRADAEFTLAPVAKRFINVNPNTISWLGLIMAAVSGVLLYFSWDYHILLLFASIAVIVSGYFDALDGKIAMDPLAIYMLDVTTIPVNMAGLPGISIPCGFADGMPVGLQLIGKALDEETLLRAAYTFEQATEFHKVFAPLGGNK